MSHRFFFFPACDLTWGPGVWLFLVLLDLDGLSSSEFCDSETCTAILPRVWSLFFSLMSPLLSGSFPVQLCLLPCCLPPCYPLSNLPVWTRHPHLSSEKTHLTEGFFRLCQVLVLWSIPDPLISQLETIKWGSQPEIWFEVGEEPIKSWISLFGKPDSSQNCSSTFML